MTKIEYRELTTMEDFKQVGDLEMHIWGETARETVDSKTLHVLHHTGGCVIGAYDADKMIGFAFGFAMHKQKRLWSHIAGVHPDYQRHGIGYALKQNQRQWSLAHDYELMSWTFDPLMRMNANFNFHKLGVIAKTYHINFYGMMSDKINAGMPSDRLEVIWDLANPQANSDVQAAPFLLHTDERGYPLRSVSSSERYHFVEIPYDFPAIKAADKPLAIAWLETFRDVMVDAFIQGYCAIDFITQAGRCWYVLERSD